MPVVCRRKPNRTKPRLFNEKSVKRVVCGALDNPDVPRQGIRDAVEECLGEEEERCDCERLRITLEQVLLALQALLVIITLLVPISALIRGATAVLLRVLPQAWTRALPSAQAGFRQLENSKPVIEGIARRVQDDLIQLRSAAGRITISAP